MAVPAIEVEGLSKRYRLGEDASSHRLADVLLPWRRGSQATEFWALRDVTFKVERGEGVGIIGRNGAGKSTLLKLLSRITAPTKGRMRVRGRVGTLLEVGTGFHPELSGRDNVFLSGTILGLSYREVKAKFDEIVAFSEVEKFIDTPVKRYSSGMQVRLAFSVALFLDPEILIVDEVLAVGDLGFQHKSVGKLRNATAKDGRTVLFVSHGLDAVAKFCERIIVLEEGRVKFDGPAKDGIDHYLQLVPSPSPPPAKEKTRRIPRKGTTRAVRLTKIDAFNSRGKKRWSFMSGETAMFRIEYEVMEPVASLALLFQLLDEQHARRQKDDDDEEEGQVKEGVITDLREIVARDPLPAGYRGAIELDLPNLRLWSGSFRLYLSLGDAENKISYDVVDAAADLPDLLVTPASSESSNRVGVVFLNHDFRNIPAEEQTIAAE